MLGSSTGLAAGYVLALLAAVVNAGAQVLQRKASIKEPSELQMSPRLLIDLARRPVWLAGISGVVLGTLFQIAGLAFGTLAAVQTVVTLELPLTLIAAAWFLGSKLRPRDWVSIVIMTAGIAGVLGSLWPRSGNATSVAPLTWTLAILATALPIGILFLLGRKREGAAAAALLGAATGISFALFAALSKGMTQQFQHGILNVVTSWQVYAVIVAAVGGMWLLQNALHAGQLAAAQPGITLLDPAVSIIWGALIFHEQMRGGIFLVLAVLSAAAIAGSALVLAGSPMFKERSGEEQP